MKKILALIFCGALLLTTDLLSQCLNPPNGVDCLCSTAQLLCTPDDLDGFTFTMSALVNSGGLPSNDLCPGIGNQDGIPNNVNWFSFIAWCTDLDIIVNISNCAQGSPPGNNDYGVQVGLFSACPSPWTPLECWTDPGQACADTPTTYPTSINFMINGMIIGNQYWFMLDGCRGSACDIMLDVVGVCGTGVIDPWTTGLTGPLTACAGDTETYMAEDLNGAVDFFYYLDGVLVGSGNEMTTYNQTWTTPGIYELCVDVANDPCIPESDPPSPYCIMVEVFDAAAGSVDIVPAVLCPGETATATITGQTIGPDYAHVILVTNATGVIEEIHTTNPLLYSSLQCADYKICSFSYVVANGPIPMIGDDTDNYDCASDCCELVCKTVSFVDNEAPVFTNSPMSETLACFDLVPAAQDITWTDNCMGTGMLAPTETGTADLCNGGMITRSYFLQDSCHNITTHDQVITVAAIVPPAFVNPPANETVACSAIPSGSGLDLMYTNNGMGGCLIDGLITPTQMGTADACGGMITYNWDFTDICNVTISHQQTITVNPTPQAAFVNPPGSVSVNCDAIPTSAPDLMYTNGEMGTCLIEGMITPTMMGTADACGGSITFSWDFTDACGRNIHHDQVVTVNPALPIAFVNPPGPVTVDCANIPSSPPDLMYTNGDMGTCLVEGMVSPTVVDNGSTCGGNITYTWDFTDGCGNNINHQQIITVDPTALPAFVNPPASMTVTCDNIPTSAPDLMYTNGETGACLIEGMITPVETGTADICGGMLTYTWDFTDACGRNINHVQNITVTAPLNPAFINPPASMTVSCDNIPTSAPDLMYTNNDLGGCLIDGTIAPVMTGSGDICGGTITFTWDYTDMCGFNINHVQDITITPALDPDFVNPPANMTVSCDNIPTSAPDLMYTNNDIGACLIDGTITPVMSGSADECGGSIIYTWDYTDMCGVNINHVQTITVDPAPEAVYLNPPADITLSCNNVPPTPPNLDYTNSETGICLIDGMTTPTISGMADECGGVITYNWDFTDQCGRPITETQTITVDPAPEAMFQNVPANQTMTCVDFFNYTAPDLNYTNGETGNCLIMGIESPTTLGAADACGGVISYVWQFTDNCGRTIQATQEITVTEMPAATFQNPPADITVACDVVPPTPPSLNYDNGLTGSCGISGSAPAVQSGSYTACGGEISFAWTHTDACGRTISEEQVVTISPAPVPTYVNPPVDITVSCDNAPVGPQTLDFDNGLTGTCGFSGSATAIQSGFYDACGGVIVLDYSFFFCNNTYSTSQTITVDPAPDAVFLNPPPNENLPCGVSTYTPPPLVASNGELGSCLIEQTVTPTVVQNGVSIDATWTFTNPCSGNVISHMQTVTVSPTPDIIINPVSGVICAGDTYDLSQVNVTDLNNTNYTYSIHTALPATPQNQVTNLVVSPAVTTDYYFVAISSFGCEDDATFTLIVDQPNNGASNGTGSTCNVGLPVNFYDFLTNVTDFSGYWFDNDNTGLNLTNAAAVFVTNVTPGTYTFTYIIPSTNSCPDHFATAIVTIIDNIQINIISAECTPDNMFYTVTFTSDPGMIDVSEGTLVDLGGGMYQVIDIPISVAVSISVINNSTGCFNFVPVNPPVCNCPVVAPPIAVPQAPVCLADLPVSLSVTVDPNQSANWYEDASGTILLEGDNLMYTPTINASGIYSYYVESLDINDPACTSLTLTQVDLEVIDGPALSPATLEACDDNNDGITTFTLSDADLLISSDGSLIVTYHETQADADACFNPLSNSYTNTTASSQVIFAKAVSTLNCTSTTEVTLQVNDHPDATIITTDETCANENNGVLDITITNGSAPIMTSLDQSTWTGDMVYDSLSPGSYTLYLDDDNGCLHSIPFTITDGQEMIIEDLQFACDDNGTGTDPTDDFYVISFELSDLNGNPDFTVLLNGVVINTFTYDVLHTIQVPADGMTYDISFVDNVSSCSLMQSLGTFTPCSTNCEISILDLTYVCNDNGTPTDPSDDFYDVSINATATNGASNGMYNVAINGVNSYTLMYDSPSSFVLAADDSSPLITLIDNEDIQCQTSMTIGPLVSCSGQCIFSVAIIETLCDDAGTVNDPADDTFTFTINATGSNVSTWTNDLGDMGSYDVNIILGPYLISDGDFMMIFTDDQDATCTQTITIVAPPSCSTNCLITIDELTYTCDDNGTPSDPSDDFYDVTLNASATNGGASGMYTVSIDGIITYTYAYGSQESFILDADGTSPNILLADVDNVQCTSAMAIGPLDPCSNLCSISLGLIATNCDNAGTVVDPLDDTFTITVLATGSNTSTWTSDTGEMGSYDVNEVLGPFLITDGDVTITITDDQDANCTAVLVVPAPPSCSTDCVINIDELTYTCNDNGTPTDATDDFYDIVLNASASNGSANNMYDVEINTINTYTFTYGVTEMFTLPADGTSPSINLIDGDDVQCSNSMLIGPLTPCSNNCTVSVALVETLCDDGGTVTDPLDDTFTITILASGTNVSTWTTDQGQMGNYDINVVLGPFLITDGDFDLTFIDDQDPTCTTILSVIAPPSCSTNCLLTILDLSATCDDNGTPSDPSDDFYNISIEAEAINGGMSNMYDVTIDGVQSYTFSYNSPSSFMLDADGTSPIITMADVDDSQCSATETIGPLTGCSDLCVMDIALLQTICDNNGTLTDPLDDTFTITIEGTGSNISTWTSDLGDVGNYNENVVLGPYLITDGAFDIIFTDDQDPNCNFTLSVTPPSSCSTDCILDIGTLNYTCDDNGTPSDPTDDFYNITLEATVTNGGSSNMYEVVIDGTLWNTYPYDVVQNFTLPADGTSPFIVLTDVDDTQCVDNMSIGPLDSCSDLCVLNGQLISIQCNDEGTVNDASDDTYIITVNISGLNTGGNWTASTGENGIYDVDTDLGPFLISDGDFMLSIMDIDDGNCLTDLSIMAPPPCSDPCEITIDPIVLLDCNDNNTGPNNDDDTFDAELTVVQILGPSDQFTVTDGTNTWGPFNYNMVVLIDGLPANGSPITLDILDVTFGQCQTSAELSMLPCSSCDETADAGMDQLIDCDNLDAQLTASATANATFTWSGPAASIPDIPNPVVQGPGLYFVTATFDNQCTYVDSVWVNADDGFPVADAGPDQLINCVDDVATLGTTLADPTDLLIVWTNELGDTISNEAILTTMIPGTYSLVLTDTINNCTSNIDQIVIDEYTNDPDATIYFDPTNILDCFVNSITIYTDDQLNVLYSWQFNSLPLPDGLQFTTMQDGEVTLIALDTISQCSSFDTLNITNLEDYPNIELLPPNQIDCEDTMISIDASGSQMGTDFEYNWYDANNVSIPNQNQLTLSVTMGGWYYLEIIDPILGCTNIDSVFVIEDVDAPILILGNGGNIDCENFMTTLNVDVTNFDPDFEINWTTTDGNITSAPNEATIEVDQAGNYTVSVTNPNNHCADVETITIDPILVPEFNGLTESDEICLGASDGQLAINEPTGGTPPYNLFINGVESNFGLITGLVPDVYDIVVTDDAGCQIDTMIQILEGATFNIDLEVLVTLTAGESYDIETQVNIPTDQIMSIVWTPSTNLSCDDCLNPTLLDVGAEVYSVLITDINGCTQEANIQFRYERNQSIYIPNIFSSGNDNINDMFTLYSDEKVELIEEMYVFDRWGEMVFSNKAFEPNQPNLGWDGRFKGEYVVQGVYVYLINVILTSGERLQFVGDVTVLHN